MSRTDQLGPTTLARQAWRKLDRWSLWDPVGRRARYGIQVARAPGEYLRRRMAARDWLAEVEPPFRIDRELGYVRIPPGALPGASEVIDRCKQRRDTLRPDLGRICAAKTGKFRMTFDLLCDEEIARDPLFLDFALSDAVFSPVVEYLRTVPFLSRIALALSVHVPSVPVPSYNQRLHIDGDDLRHVKLFLNTEDVGDGDGPLTFLNAAATRRVVGELRRADPKKRARSVFTDEEVFARCERSEIIKLSGAAGQAALVDLSRCMHFGSRLAPERERLVLALFFLRYHRLHGTPANVFEQDSTDLHPVRRLALRHPRRYPSGYFFPDPRLHPSAAERGQAGSSPASAAGA